MGVTFERVNGWLARIGISHEIYGDPYEATAHVTQTGIIKGFSGKAAPRTIREALRAVESELGLVPSWERFSMYKIEVRAIDSHGRTNPTVIFEADNYADWVKMQRMIADAFFSAGEARIQAESQQTSSS